MVAAVEARIGALCAIAWTGRVKLHAAARTYCGIEANAADGVKQVPSIAITCEHCKREIKALYGVDL